jgi:hypothetical protein
MNPQQQSGQPERKEPGSKPAQEAPGRGQAGKSGPDQPSDRPGTSPQDPADLGYDPKPDNVQARGNAGGSLGQSGEKSSR